MSQSHDEKALRVLEVAVGRAKKALEKTEYFQPFLMLLNVKDEVKVFENGELDGTQSYALLEEQLKEYLCHHEPEVLVLAMDTTMPQRYAHNVPPHAIRLHLEEKSQLHKKISARFLFVPYERCKTNDSEVFVTLYAPVAVGFPAEYLVS